MSRIGNVITSVRFGQNRAAQMKVVEIGSANGQECLRLSSSVGREAVNSVSPDVGNHRNMALSIYEMSRSFERLSQVKSKDPSAVAAHCAKISINAQELGLNATMALAQKLGELAMAGNHLAKNDLLKQLQKEMVIELSALL